MEYLLGSLVTILTIVLVRMWIHPDRLPYVNPIKHRQSHIYEISKDFLGYYVPPFKELNTQAYNYFKENSLRVLMVNDKAYWIQNNNLLVSDVIDGEIADETTKKVDTMSLDKVQLEEIAFVVEKLTEGMKNDGGNSGKS
jgi:hypothetical protein